MTTSDPVAFLSYVRADDEHERGRITLLRNRLEGEVRMQTGRPFSIFQDKKDISWGQQWRERLDTELFNVTFLVPIITPGYFNSSACRDEFDKFLVREKQLGKNTLILPIYYLDSDQMQEHLAEQDPIAKVVSQRNYADWRPLRFKDINSAEIDEHVALMAQTIKVGMREIQAEIAAAEAKPRPAPEPPSQSPMLALDSSLFAPDVPAIRGRTERRPLSPYYAYTTEFDEVVSADTLIDPDSVKALQAEIDRAKRNLMKAFSKLISPSVNRLATIDFNSKPRFIFLVDNSGSFRQESRMTHIAGWLRIICAALEANEIDSEILGFTTRAWKGGESRETWLSDGRPPHPGRLNDLRHIIYKSFDQPIGDCDANLGLMASGRLLKENIDGEALLWAFERSRIETDNVKTVILMITDGAPVDDSTLLSNSEDFLMKHLLATIQWLRNQPNIAIYGVGIDHDTQSFFPEGIPKVSPKEMGVKVLEAIPSWLEAHFTH